MTFSLAGQSLLAENGKLQRQLADIRHVDWEGTIAELRQEVAQLQHVRDDQQKSLQGLLAEHREHEMQLRAAAEAGVGHLPRPRALQCMPCPCFGA